MSIHYAIINDLSNARHETATLEVTASVSSDVTFTVFPLNADPAAPIAVPQSANHHCISPNLLDLAGNRRAIVRAVVVGGISTAVLRQRAGGTKILLYVPEDNKVLGTEFALAIGDLGAATHILVGNPIGVNTTLDIRYGDPMSPIAETHQILPWQPAVIRLTQANTRVQLFAHPRPVFIQLAVDTGKVDETFVLPV